jgi:glycine dehydrogenase subunit 1
MTLAQKKSRIAVAESLWTQTQQVLKTYGYGRNLEFIAISSDSQTGKLNLEQLNNAHGKGDLAGVILQSPNCYGVIEDLKAVTDLCKKHNALCTLSYNPWLSSLLKTPGDLGVDIVACEGQVFGLPLSSGGPSLGILATHKELRKFMPGRIIGRVADIYGQPAYAMVHEDREQHVAREKATSNLCSNQALCAIRSVVYLSTLGESGFQAVGDLNLKKSHYLADKLCALKGVSLRYKQPFFNEFLIQMPGKASQLLKFMESKNIFAGIDGATLGITLGQTIQENCLLIAVTENKSKEDLDQYIAYFSEWIKTT